MFIQVLCVFKSIFFSFSNFEKYFWVLVPPLTIIVFCVRCRHSSSAPDLRATVSHSLSSTVSVLSPSMLTQILQIPDSPPFKNAHFQYVLGAATSIATKINEESMTYLNQGIILFYLLAYSFHHTTFFYISIETS